MCILICKPADSKLTEDQFRNCWLQNDHGTGFVVPDSDTTGGFYVFKEPSPKTHETAWVEYLKYQDRPMLLHFRWATHGSKNVDNTHPFKASDLWYAAHNGVITDVTTGTDESDTRAFVRKLLTPSLARDDSIVDDPHWIEGLEDFLSTNKVAIMNKDGRFVIFNRKLGTEDGGIWWSNTGYKTCTSRYTSTYDRFPGRAHSYDYSYACGYENTLKQTPSTSTSITKYPRKPVVIGTKAPFIVAVGAMFIESTVWDHVASKWKYTLTSDIYQARTWSTSDSIGQYIYDDYPSAYGYSRDAHAACRGYFNDRQPDAETAAKEMWYVYVLKDVVKDSKPGQYRYFEKRKGNTDYFNDTPTLMTYEQAKEAAKRWGCVGADIGYLRPAGLDRHPYLVTTPIHKSTDSVLEYRRPLLPCESPSDGDMIQRAGSETILYGPWYDEMTDEVKGKAVALRKFRPDVDNRTVISDEINQDGKCYIILTGMTTHEITDTLQKSGESKDYVARLIKYDWKEREWKHLTKPDVPNGHYAIELTDPKIEMQQWQDLFDDFSISGYDEVKSMRCVMCDAQVTIGSVVNGAGEFMCADCFDFCEHHFGNQDGLVEELEQRLRKLGEDAEENEPATEQDESTFPQECS